MGNAAFLKCKNCGRRYDVAPLHICQYCFGPLEVEYNFERVAKVMSKKRIRKGPRSLWRYRDLLPVDLDSPVELSAGDTPLLHADRLGRELGLRFLYIKNECANPTCSIKDRMVSVAVSKAIEFRFNTLACASAGNLAHSLAAHAARAGLRCVIFLPADVDPSLVTSAGVYGAEIISVKGGPEEVNRICTEAASGTKWAFINVQLRPFYAEGAKTLAFEIAEQLDFNLPDNVVMPMATGATISGVHRGFQELRRLLLVRNSDVRLIGAQAEGCSPIVTAFENDTSVILPAKPKTIVKSLSVGTPSDGIYALNAIRDSAGMATSVTDEEIVEGVKLLARTEGIFSEPSGGAAVAALRKLVQKKKIRAGEQTVLVIPARGLSSPDQVQMFSALPHEIEPTKDELHKIVVKLEIKSVPGEALAGDAEDDPATMPDLSGASDSVLS